MAKTRRTAKQKAATRKMLAANKKKRRKKAPRKRAKKRSKKRGKKRRKKAAKKRSGPTYCLISPSTLKVLSCHKSRSKALEAMSKKRTKHTPLVLTRAELKKVKENRPKRRRKKKVARRGRVWNP